MKKPLIIGLVVVLVIASIFALGSLGLMRTSSSFDYRGGVAADVAPMETAYPESVPMVEESIEKGESQSPSFPSGEKIIRDIRYEIRSKNFDEDRLFFDQLPNRFGGSVETLDQGSYYSGTIEQRYYNVRYRIPTDRLDSFIQELEKNRPIYHKYYNQYSVTDSYNQTEARLKTLKATEERYLELLTKATDIPDIISIEQALTNVQSEIEWLSLTKDQYDKDIDYTAVNVNLSEVLASDPLTGQITFWDQLKDAFLTGIATFFRGLSELIFLILRLWPILLILGIGLTIFLVRFKRKKPTE